MKEPLSLTINDTKVSAMPGQTILDTCRKNGIALPGLCDFKGLKPVGACRLCLVEIEGVPKLLPACTTPVADNQVIRTSNVRLEKYRRLIVELFFAERNHVCSVCVANGACELQVLASRVGMDHVRFPSLHPEATLDASHERFILDHNRCILCTRCARVCREVEQAQVWDVMGRGFRSRIVCDLNSPWGDSTTCTSCGKCVEVCPTGALWPKKAAQGTLKKNPERISGLIEKREVPA